MTIPSENREADWVNAIQPVQVIDQQQEGHDTKRVTDPL